MSDRKNKMILRALNIECVEAARTRTCSSWSEGGCEDGGRVCGWVEAMVIHQYTVSIALELAADPCSRLHDASIMLSLRLDSLDRQFVYPPLKVICLT